MIVDTHCHIYEEYYDNLDILLKDIQEENIILIVNGVDPKSNREILSLTKKYPFVYGTIGFHPSEADKINENDYIELEEQLKEEKIVGIGEIGLDYYWTKENKEEQLLMFKKQLDLAKKYNFPVIIHNREATEDIINMLSNYNLKGIIHAYSKSVETARIFIKMGYKLGIGGVLTFKNSNLKDVIKQLDVNNLVVETDSPYLTPEPNRGKKNSPLYTKLIIEQIAKIKGISDIKIKEELFKSTIEIFDLKLWNW